MRYLISLFLFLAGTAVVCPQQVTTSVAAFCRSGIYAELMQDNPDDLFSSAFGDAGLRADIRNGAGIRAYVDVRYRLGMEFRENMSGFQLREVWVSVDGKKLGLTMGQRIVKWGHADFDNPLSTWNPRNMIARSPDSEDRDLGNIIASLSYRPASFISFEALLSPFFRSDVLVTTPLELPDFVVFNSLEGLKGGKSMYGYGFRTEVFLKGIDFSVSYFDGNDPLPGIMVSDWSLEITGDMVLPSLTLDASPYRIKRLGAGFEAAAGRFGLRGEFAFNKPSDSFRSSGHIPMPEVKWAAGADFTAGIFSFGAEWIGKFITDFEPSPVEPLVPGDFPPLTPDMIALIPGGFGTFLEMQITTFNRLYMYQLEEVYHSVAARVEADIASGLFTPSLVAHYNFTSGDLALVPAIRYKPADGLTLVAGADIYKGREGSLFDILDEPLTNLFVALKVDF